MGRIVWVLLVLMTIAAETSAKCQKALGSDDFVELTNKPKKRTGSKANYMCKDSADRIVGEDNSKNKKTITCLKNGKWDAQRPCCEKKKCSAPGEGTNTFPVPPNTETEVGEFFEYKCLPGYESFPPMEVECQASFTYFPAPPTCTKVNCGKPPDGINTKLVPSSTDLNYQDVFLYECKPGFSTADPTVAVCLANGAFSIAPPTCNLIDYCNPNPCLNGGTCTEGAIGYCCDCPIGASGKNCENVTTNCTVVGCQNGGTCAPTQQGGDAVCTCLDGWTGENCEKNIDDCQSNPCKNGGNCTDGVDSFTCSCTSSWQGATCSVRNCPTNWKRSPKNVCYHIPSQLFRSDWFAAKETCQDMGGSLVILQDLDKAQDVYDAGGTTFGVGYWVGGGQLTNGTQSFYEWIDGTPVNSSIVEIRPEEIASPAQEMIVYRFLNNVFDILVSDSTTIRPYVCEQ